MRRAGSIAAIGCVAVAAGSLLLPSEPTTDPWGWIVWGREVIHLDLSTAVGGAPSWKPLPVLVTTPLALFGGAAPVLWMLALRTAGLLGLVVAYRVGTRLAGPVAGVVAAGGILLSSHWLRSWLHGYAEPLAILLLLLAVDRHWSGRPRQALLLGAGVCLVRPEALAIAGVYGLVLWRRGELSLPFVAGVSAAVVALWVVPDWVGSGDPLHGSNVAHSVVSGTASTALSGATQVVVVPLALAALAGLAVAVRRHDTRTLGLAAITVGWLVLLIVLMLLGYPASDRFFDLPAALVCVLGGAGAVRAVEMVAPRRPRLALAGVVVLAALPVVVGRTQHTGAVARDSIRRARIERALSDAITRAGPKRLRACGVPLLPSGLGWMRGQVAWLLELPMRKVHDVRTTGDTYLESLSRSGTGTPPAADGRPVIVDAPPGRYLLLAPFGGARLRSSRRGASNLVEVTGESRWRLLVPGSGSCARRSGEPTRAA